MKKFLNSSFILKSIILLLMIYIIYILKTSSAFNEYRQNIISINKQNQEFKNQVLFSLLPDLNQNQTNIIMNIITQYLTSTEKRTKTDNKNSCSIYDQYSKTIKHIPFSYSVANSDISVCVYGHYLRCGDRFFESEIEYIDPFQIETATTIYYNSNHKTGDSENGKL